MKEIIMTTFADLLADLQTLDPMHPLVFVTDEGEIGAGYHVTELRHSTSKGIDCGGKIETWQETRLQLLDGQGSTHMSVGKFSDIVQQSLSALPELAQAPLLAEFGHNNSGLMLMSVGAPELQDETVVLRLGKACAICKPAQRNKGIGDEASSCCGSIPNSVSKTSCCSTVMPRVEANVCCG